MAAGLTIGRNTKQALNHRLLKVYREDGFEWQVWQPVSMRKNMIEIVRDTKDGMPAKVCIVQTKADINNLLNIFGRGAVPSALIDFLENILK